MRFVLCMYTDQEERNFRNSIRPAEGFFLAVCVCVCIYDFRNPLLGCCFPYTYVCIRTDRTANISNIFGVLEEKNTSLRISEDRLLEAKEFSVLLVMGRGGSGGSFYSRYIATHV